MTHPNQALIERFYTAFAARDADGMASVYALTARFSDPVFVALEGEEVPMMWRMLCARAKDLRIEHTNVTANDTEGSAHWEAWYPFAATGRRVHNVIDAHFRFAGGLIVDHRDEFDFGSWSRQAIGLPAILLGFTPIIRNKVQKTAADELARYIAKH